MALNPILAVAIALSLQVAISDLYARRVSNRVLLCAIGGAGICYVSGVAGPLSGVDGMLGFCAGLVAMLPFYAMRVMGAGDVKFFAVLGLLLGWKALLPVWVVASLMAGVYALCVLSWRRVEIWIPSGWSVALVRHVPSCVALRGKVLAARQGRQGIPYATCLAMAAMAWMVWG
nr:prepilin peptidase [Pseudoxanthomonas sp. GM95]